MKQRELARIERRIETIPENDPNQLRFDVVDGELVLSGEDGVPPEGAGRLPLGGQTVSESHRRAGRGKDAGRTGRRSLPHHCGPRENMMGKVE